MQQVRTPEVARNTDQPSQVINDFILNTTLATHPKTAPFAPKVYLMYLQTFPQPPSTSDNFQASSLALFVLFFDSRHSRFLPATAVYDLCAANKQAVLPIALPFFMMTAFAYPFARLVRDLVEVSAFARCCQRSGF